MGGLQDKVKENGEIDKYKAHWVAKSYKKEFGVDYKEVFTLIVRKTWYNQIWDSNNSPKFMAYLQLDVKFAFLHGD